MNTLDILVIIMPPFAVIIFFVIRISFQLTEISDLLSDIKKGGKSR